MYVSIQDSIDVLSKQFKIRHHKKLSTRENPKWVAVWEFLDALHMLTFYPKIEENLMKKVKNVFLLNIVKNTNGILGY